MFLWLPSVDYVSSSGTSSSSSSSSGQSCSSERWQLAYSGGGGSQPLVPLQLYTAPLAFLEHGEGSQRRPWQELSHFRVQLGEPQPPQQEDKHKDYYANVGDCIRTLREDIPLLFSKDLNCEFPGCHSSSWVGCRGLLTGLLGRWTCRGGGVGAPTRRGYTLLCYALYQQCECLPSVVVFVRLG